MLKEAKQIKNKYSECEKVLRYNKFLENFSKYLIHYGGYYKNREKKDKVNIGFLSKYLTFLMEKFDLKIEDFEVVSNNIENINFNQAVEYDLQFNLSNELISIIRNELTELNVKESIINQIVDNVNVNIYPGHGAYISSTFLNKAGILNQIFNDVNFNIFFTTSIDEIKEKIKKFVCSKKFGTYLKNVEHWRW
ncbi:hypothetical protein [Caminibacter pacificus]|uniref:Uncharacterized protein n=1 Tax=Caminibacter pacificus TaxID=1424653 RepID=A0AAJ4UWY2_9BACT|nr:hypothetical protein [Caminibacter pacificus]QDD68200.1 hypothetical protein C6V80_10115 [Caminibacter pacificus]ROR38713.1 hypothetical protein EDC58_1928 [Caminibacter pacificus]